VGPGPVRRPLLWFREELEKTQIRSRQKISRVQGQFQSQYGCAIAHSTGAKDAAIRLTI
jgi:hypothetical protein